ncbi:MAG TPA: PilZ domain-containing protein [Desulfomonilaceae bacterium]|nr:PilZ domain-containing protein [Desulfomonilaceae bacterium]
MKRRISAKSMREDIRSGLSEAALMAKHHLSSKGLQRLFNELIHAKIVTHQDLYKRFASYRERTDQVKQRQARRAGLSVKLPVCDVGSTSFGIVRDISETGLRVAGIKYQVGDVTTFQLPIDAFMKADPLLVIAKCQWVSEKGKKTKYFVAGFEFIDLSDSDLNSLRDFVSFLLASKSGEWQTTI